MAKINIVGFGIIFEGFEFSSCCFDIDDDDIGVKTTKKSTFIFFKPKFEPLPSKQKEIYIRYLNSGYYPKNQLLEKFRIKSEFFNITEQQHNIFLEKLKKSIEIMIDLATEEKNNTLVDKLKNFKLDIKWLIVQYKIKTIFEQSELSRIKHFFNPEFFLELSLPIK